MDYIMTEVKNIKWNFSSYTDAKGRTYIISYYNQWDSEYLMHVDLPIRAKGSGCF